MKRNLHSIAAVVAVLHCGVSFAKDEKTETKQVDGASKREPSASPDPKTTAAEEARARRAAAQKALNDQVVAKEFKVEDPKKIDAYVEEQMKKKVKPVEQAPSHWRPGFTCNDLLAFQPVDWAAYRNCRYYYRYYGRYWR